MNTVKFDSKNAKVIAHRGVCGLEPENTVSAFIAAGNRSYYGIECDVHVTKDGKFVVIHDDHTGRVASERIEIENSTLEEIKKIKLDNICGLERKELGPDIHYSDRSDLYIPEMSEYIKICKKYGKQCVLELKNQMAENYIKNIVEEIEKLDYLKGVTFISFSLENMIILRNMLPNQQLQYLVSKCVSDSGVNVIDVLNEYSLDLDIHYKALSKDFIDEVHKNGHIVNCWTCDIKEIGEQLAMWGADQITSNILE